MQVARGSVWDRLCADLGALAGRNHSEQTEPMFALAVEHIHPASPPCWPVARRRVIDAESRELAALARRIGPQVRDLYIPHSRKGSARSLAARFGLSADRVMAVVQHLAAA